MAQPKVRTKTPQTRCMQCGMATHYAYCDACAPPMNGQGFHLPKSTDRRWNGEDMEPLHTPVESPE